MTSLAHVEHGGPLGIDNERVQADFSVSLNVFGPAPSVMRAVRDAAIDVYPDPLNVVPREAAARAWDVALDEVAFGAGASELIYAITASFLAPGDCIVVPQPTYGEYERAARVAGAEVHIVPGDPSCDYSLDVQALTNAILERKARLAFVCSPNNPTGEQLSHDALCALADACASVDGLLVLDQSYDAFAERPLGTPGIRGHRSVLHLRSITKDHALAGVRAGFVVGAAEHIRRIELARVPWTASTMAQAAAAAALTPAAEAHATAGIAMLRLERARIVQSFANAGFETISGATHTLLARVGSGATVRTELLAYGIKVRDCASFGLSNYIRIAARTPRENELLLAAIPTIAASRPKSEYEQ